MMETRDAGDAAPILHALFLTAFQGREICGQIFARLIALADPERPIPASTGASADRAGGFSACRTFGAAGVYYEKLIKPAEK